MARAAVGPAGAWCADDDVGVAVAVDVSDARRVVCGISFGFADNAHKVNSYRTSRASVADTVTFVEE